MRFNEYFNTMLDWDDQADWADAWNTRKMYSIDAYLDNLNELEIAYTLDEIAETVNAWMDENE